MAKTNDVLPSGRDVPFAEIEATLARLVRDGRRRKRSPARALTATVIVIGGTPRLAAAAEALEQLGESAGVRAILISEGPHTAPIAHVTENAIAIDGLAPRFLNNAVAALRLSSLPAAVWWRGGSIEALDDLARLADRLVLDLEDPDPAWRRAADVFETTALTDLRWTRLTRWRSALAHLFDLPKVRDAGSSFRRLSIAATDRDAARLFAGWLRSRLRWPADFPIDITADDGAAGDAASPLTRVALEGTGLSITLQVRQGRGCLAAAVDGLDASTRIVPLGDGSLASLIGEELGVRTRDLAFEQALAAALEIHQ
jgi:glucose-6-phosphate dehydrogenase assembly protein OpcA